MYILYVMKSASFFYKFKRKNLRIFGLVIYAGMETKILKNRNNNTKKYSFFEKTFQQYFLMAFTLLTIFSIVNCN